jgi:hypothetical protein
LGYFVYCKISKELGMEIQLQDAAQTLKDHFGERLDVGQEEGRERMAEALQARMDLSEEEAKEVVAALEESRTVRWETGTEEGVEPTMGIPMIIPFGGQTAPQSHSTTGPTAAAAPLMSVGYWRL